MYTNLNFIPAYTSSAYPRAMSHTAHEIVRTVHRKKLFATIISK